MVSSFPICFYIVYLSSKYLLISTVILFLTHWLFRNVLLNLQSYGDLLVNTCFLISCLIYHGQANVLCIILVLWNLLYGPIYGHFGKCLICTRKKYILPFLNALFYEKCQLDQVLTIFAHSIYLFLICLFILVVSLEIITCMVEFSCNRNYIIQGP